MKMFLRHKLATFFILIYFFFFKFIINWFSTGLSLKPNSCGAANGMLVIIAFIFFLLYLIIVIIKIGSNDFQNKSDYKKFLLLIFLIPIGFIIWILIN